jgi:hypothetical protein
MTRRYGLGYGRRIAAGRRGYLDDRPGEHQLCDGVCSPLYFYLNLLPSLLYSLSPPPFLFLVFGSRSVTLSAALDCLPTLWPTPRVHHVARPILLFSDPLMRLPLSLPQ